MKHFFVMLITFIVLISFMPKTSIAAGEYDSYDFSKVQSFLDKPSAVSGKTNGQCINPAYERNNPITWIGVEWNTLATKRVIKIGKSDTWNGKSLSGTLDLAGCEKITDIYCNNNQINSINVEWVTSLQRLYCSGNPLGELHVESNTSLLVLECKDAGLSELYLGSNAALAFLKVSGNELTSLDVGGKSLLYYVNCSANNISSLNISGCTNLQTLLLESNALSLLDVSTNTKLEQIWCGTNHISELNLENNNLLREINCENNDLTSLTFGNLPELEYLLCQGNKLGTLDLSRMPNLSALYCGSNRLSSLDTSYNPRLSMLYCENNRISSLDLSSNTNLSILFCMDNRITDLEVVFVWAGASLDSTGNPLKHIFMKAGNSSILLNAKGDGFVELLYLEGCNASAVPNEGGFIEWKQANTHVSSEKKIELETGTNYSLVAVFGYIATFNGNGADQEASPEKINAVPGETIDPPDAEPVREGYIFGGWFKDGQCTNAWKFDTDIVDENITLYAKWIKELELALEIVPAEGRIKVGEQLSVSANVEDGKWDFDESYFTVEFTEQTAVFTGLREGETSISYTVAGEQTDSVYIIIEAEESTTVIESSVSGEENNLGSYEQMVSPGKEAEGSPSSSNLSTDWYWWAIMAVALVAGLSILFVFIRFKRKK